MTLQRFETAIEASINNALKEVHTALPGVITSFDPGKQTCTVQLGVKRIFSGDIQVSIPPLINVPVATWKAGGFAIMFPVKPGDQCIVIFNERSISNWIAQGGEMIPAHRRTHDLSDGVAFPCLSTEQGRIGSYSADDLVISSLENGAAITLKESGDAEIGSENATLTVKQSGGIEIKNNVSGQSLFDLLVSLTNFLSTEPNLVNTAQYAAIKANLQTFG